MAIQQAGSSYRDPMKAMTIKALQARQAAAAAATAESMKVPAQIASPWQGISHLTGILGSEYSQNKVDSAEADARNRLAALKAGINMDTGATSQQLADIGQLDPEFADKEYARSLAAREAQKMELQKEKFQTSEREGTQGFTAGQTQAGFTEQEKQAKTAADVAAGVATTADTRQAAQKATDAATATDKDLLDAALRNDSAPAVDEAIKRGLMTPEEGKQRKEAIRVKDLPDQFRDMTPEERATAHVADGIIAQVNTRTGQKSIGSYPQQSPGQQQLDVQDAKDINEWVTNGKATLVKNRINVDRAINLLSSGKAWTGPFIGQLPDSAQAFINPQGTQARDAVRSAVGESLTATLGAQFAEREGQQLMDRAFSMTQSNAENIKRARLIMEQLDQVAAVKDSMTKWAQDHDGLMKGWVPPAVDVEAVKAKLSTLFTDDGSAAGAPAGPDSDPAGILRK